MEKIELTFENVDQFRLKIYEEARELFLNHDELGLCNCVKSAMVNLGFKIYPLQSEMESYFPELWAYKPEESSLYSFWWPRDCIKERLKALTEIIHALKNGH